MSNDSVWVNYGISMKLPVEDIKGLREYLKEKGYYIVYDIYSLEGIRIIKTTPSGNRDGENVEIK